MSEEYAIHWLEDVVHEIIARNQHPIVLSAGKTTSGHVHLGFMREVIIGDAVRRILRKMRKEVIFRIFLDTYDAAKRFPPYIDTSYAKKYLGHPFALIPSPFEDIKADSYAEYFGKELVNSFPNFGIVIQVIWTHALYHQPEMQEQIRIGLKKADEVKEIILSHLTHALSEDVKEQRYDSYKNWMPAMVVCESCGKTQIKNKNGEITPNRVVHYNEEKDTVTYQCPACEHSGEVAISSGLVKLNWRLDWPAKWALVPKNVFECSGKDHFTKITGSWDVAIDLCNQIYNYRGPVGLGFEWMRLGDSDMGTSRGVVFMPKTYYSMAEPELLRMLVLTTNPSRHISFRIEELSLLYDEFERIERIYYGLEEPFDIKKKIEDQKFKVTKEIVELWEEEIKKEISVQLKQESNVEERKKLAQKQNSLIKKTLDQRKQSELHSATEERLKSIEKTETEEYNRQKKEIAFLYPLIRAKRVQKRCPPQIPHKFLVNMVQLRKFLSFEEIMKKAQKTQVQKQIHVSISKNLLRRRLRQTSNWLNYIKSMIEEEEDPNEKKRLESKVDLFEIPKSVPQWVVQELSDIQKTSLGLFSDWLHSIQEITEENLKNTMIGIRDKTGINAKSLFEAIYLVLIGRQVGPRLGPFIILMDLQWVQDRFKRFQN
ncbi:MAG: lysine--tRNA ligase [Candidatus Lokiarchaeota archaeon]|nr:lysine--tRNA ligase [Candidatus Lokiarchaeota archaeon]